MLETKKVKMYLGIPSTGSRADLQTYFLRDAEKKYGDRIEFIYPKQCIHRSFHDFARNSIVEEFKESGADVLWFIDSDVVPPDNVLDLITEHLDKWMVSGACYPIWMVPPGGDETCVLFTAYNGIVEKDGKVTGIGMTEVPQKGLAFVDGLATGCLLIKKEVFELLKKPYFEFKYDPETRQFKEGEDLGFAIKLNKLGIQFFTDYSMVCKHYKNVCLLDINNYAVSWSNKKVLDYDKEVRQQVMQAVSAAELAGYERARKEYVKAAPKKTTASGLILPSSF